MNILIVNDDGINAEGLKLLTKAAAHHGTVYVAAPKHQQSAKSASITIKGPIEVTEVEPLFGSVRSIAVDGYPADAVRAGLKIFDQEFDLVLSGINHGCNIAHDVQYSGTVGAAFEAAILGLPAIAFSAADINLSYVYDETVKLLDEIIENKLYHEADVLNVNYPHYNFQKVLGTKITKLGKRLQHLEFMKTDKPNMYNLSHSIMKIVEDDTSDVYAYENGYVSITPIKFDRTDYKKIEKILK
ncbi:5'/3'-nucleotidase SurE [Acholeplasma equirhinis]|uniref:5'/3'-nucleotidase SurE n=1 Tax=Acholeplasma equirhinis TaxID=555393 RepID=UPI00197ADD6E|nr:5'/3'-nucleotidase SurE [Acholeplasma equirhinis]MBN3490384.1 5'/3'-nucleotidase SurE [Acholeplasma equirhinis]